MLVGSPRVLRAVYCYIDQSRTEVMPVFLFFPLFFWVAFELGSLNFLTACENLV